MKLSVSTLACPQWPLEKILAVASGNGLAGVELRGLEKEIDVTRSVAFAVHTEETLAKFRAAKLAIPCIATSVTLLAPPGDRWDDMLDECHRAARLAHAAAAPFVRIFGGKAPEGLESDEALTTARRRLRQIVKTCRPRNCVPVIETHDDWSTAARLLELLEGFEASEAAALWDVEHSFRAGEAPADTVGELAEYLGMVHFKDSNHVNGLRTPTLLGKGEVPLDDCILALREAGFSGWISLETEKRWFEQAPGPEESIADFAAFMRRDAGTMAS